MAVFLTYLFCGLFNSKGFVVNFVVIILLQAVDFWFVKVRLGRFAPRCTSAPPSWKFTSGHTPPERERP